MARLEDLTTGARVTGVVANQPVTVVQVQWHGTQAITLTYRDDAGHPGEQLLYRDNEPQLTVEQASTAWSFTADGALFRLVSEARRIELAYLFDPLLAVTTSNVLPLPHQITAVYEEMLPRQPLHFLLADDPGAGKTIMAGLFIKELMIRGDVKRCLIVCPGMLVDQWQDELHEKFHLSFDIVTRDMIEASHSGNPFLERNLLITRLDHLSRNEELQARLAQSEWDLVVCDEAHKMSAHYFGSEVKETKRYKLGKLLGEITRHLLLMTATPHSGKPEDFGLFMALLDSDRFAGRVRGKKEEEAGARDLMRRLSKEQLRTMEGRPLFPERRAYTVKYTLSEPEAYLYEQVTNYVRDEMNRADSIAEDGGGRRRMAVGLALTTLQRRLASSPAAIHESLKRRLKRLEARLAEEKLLRRGAAADVLVTEEARVASGQPALAFVGSAAGQALDIDDFDELDDLPDDELEELEEQVVDQASAARTIAELEAEIATLARLEEVAKAVRASGMDRKWEQLSSLLQESQEMFDSNGEHRKLIIFSEHRDTLNYLVEKLRTVLGRAEAVVAIHGGLGRQERRKAQEYFTQDKDALILVATDAAGEGINLQRAHLMVNYDLPWNPNRIEQRFGRIHRIGQTEVCHLWNLVAHETREGQVFERLLEKLNEMSRALGDKVFDVLSDDGVFEDQPLRDLLLDAIRYGDQPEVRARLFQQVDEAMGGNLGKVLAERALARDIMGSGDVERIRDEMEKAEARKLQPHFIRTFFADAFTRLGGRMAKRDADRYEITHVPADIRAAAAQLGARVPVLKRYERVTFDRDAITVPGKPVAEFVCPGHPLLDATVNVIQQRHRTLLKEGAILVADADRRAEPRALIFLEHAIQDGRPTAGGGRRVVSKRFEFVEVGRDGNVQLAGYAPYLDYRPITGEERALIENILSEDWLAAGLETKGMDYAIEKAVPEHLAEVKRHTLDRITRTETAVKDRLTKEINYWDHRADQLKEQELAGKKPKLNSGKARQRAEEMADRLKRRMEELAQEKQLSPLPPVVVGGALIIPAGLLRSLRPEPKPKFGTMPEDTTVSERIAVDAVMVIERELGYEPTEMDHFNPGYDILSKDPIKGELRFIEVKGRVAGAPVVTVTRTEILTALNKGEQFILALVAIDDGKVAKVHYLRNPFEGEPETYFDTTSVNYDWQKLIARSGRPT
jgi:SNF2 family DNA or RNA helicase